MEYLEQGDLLAYLNHGPPLSERDVKVIASQILEGLTMMHGNEFVHGDLKPNVSSMHVPRLRFLQARFALLSYFDLTCEI